MRSQIKTSNKKKTRKTTAKKPFIRGETISKVSRVSLRGGLNHPNESKIVKVGKYRALVTRAERLNYYGNPVHTATLFGKDGTYGVSARSSGSVDLALKNCFQKNGIDVKYTKKKSH